MDLLSQDIGCFWHSEERSHQGWQFLYLSEMGKYQKLQLVWASYGLSSDAMVLEMIPDLFVGIEFRGIRGNKKELQAAFSGCNELRNSR